MWTAKLSNTVRDYRRNTEILDNIWYRLFKKNLNDRKLE